MQFYSLKTRSHVEIPDHQVTKVKLVPGPGLVRHAFTAPHGDSSVFKFTNEKTWNESAIKEGKHTTSRA